MKEDPLTPALSRQARLGVLATQSVRKRMRMGEEVCCGLQQRPFSQPYPLTDMATLIGKHAEACLRGEGQDEGVS